MQMEQLQRQPDTISSLLNLKITAPQWHLPLYVFVGTVKASLECTRGEFPALSYYEELPVKPDIDIVSVGHERVSRWQREEPDC
jgi:hypothetical protein